MRDSVIILCSFLLGVILALCGALDSLYLTELEDLSSYALYFLLFIVGLSVGLDDNLLKAIRQIPHRVLILPLIALGGTIIGSILSFFILNYTSLLFPSLSLHKIITLSSGMGYYSITAILCTQVWGAQIGSIALLVNLLRELTTVVAAPVLSRFFGKYAATSLGGATAMDTSLPIIMKVDGNYMLPVALYNGIFFTIVVPVLISLLFSLS